jgi:hypothetical protein
MEVQMTDDGEALASGAVPVISIPVDRGSALVELPMGGPGGAVVLDITDQHLDPFTVYQVRSRAVFTSTRCQPFTSNWSGVAHCWAFELMVSEWRRTQAGS